MNDDKPVLTRNDSGDSVILVPLTGRQIGTIRFIRSGKDKGKFHWHSLLAIAPYREGLASSEAEALAHIGFKVSSCKEVATNG